MFCIEKNVPLEQDGQNLKGATKFMRNLEIGDSFEIPEKLRTGAAAIAIQCGIKVTTKKQQNGMVRVWRIS